MPPNSEEGPWPQLLAERSGAGADAAGVADTVVAVWLDIDETLHPIIGRGGVAALYHRSLTLTQAAHPWLDAGLPGMRAAVDTTALKAALAAQTASQALAAGGAMFQSFHALLASLVGASLTDRLLRSVWVHSSGISPAQDSSS